mgnify:CR=1 FL=1
MIKQVLHVVSGILDAAIQKADGIVDFMGNPCHQVAERGHFFALDDFELSLLEVLQCLRQRSIIFLNGRFHLTLLGHINTQTHEANDLPLLVFNGGFNGF